MYAIVHAPDSHQHFRRSLQLAAIEDVLPDGEVHTVCRQLGYAWRNRQLPPGCLVRSMVYRGLSSDRSIAAVLADLAALTDRLSGPTDAAWCQARDRLPEAVLFETHFRLTRRMRRRFGSQHTCWGRPVFLIDGTGVSMPDTPPEDIRFAGAAKTILAFSHELAHVRGHRRRTMFCAMLRHIARQTNHHPFGRAEPRLVKRDPVRYGILRITRDKARLKGLT